MLSNKNPLHNYINTNSALGTFDMVTLRKHQDFFFFLLNVEKDSENLCSIIHSLSHHSNHITCLFIKNGIAKDDGLDFQSL